MSEDFDSYLQTPVEEHESSKSELVPPASFVTGTLTDPRQERNEIERMIGFKKITVKTDTLFDLITRESSGVPVYPALLINAGLPQCRKSSILQMMYKENVKEAKEAMAKCTDEKHGITPYELSATISPYHGKDDPPTYEATTKTTTYLYAFESALKSHFLWQSKLIYNYCASSSSEKFFEDDRLNEHLQYIMKELQKNHFESQSHEWHRKISNGLTLLNIWDVNVNKAVFHFLPALMGKLSRCHMWLFFDYDRDFENFHKRPHISPDENDRNDDKHFMPYRTRLYYLLRQALLLKSESRLKQICSIFGLMQNQDTGTNTEFEVIINGASRMGISDIIPDERITTLNPCSYNNLKTEMDEIVLCTQETEKTIPLKYIFLRSLFYSLTIVFVSRSELNCLARQVEMSVEDVRHFCEIFTSSGSIFDLDESLNFVIMKPMHFVRELENLFYPKQMPNDELIEFGLLKSDRAKKIFGKDHYEYFLQVLVSLNMIVDLSQHSVYVNGQPFSSDDVYYVPDVRGSPPDLSNHPKSLHLLLDINCSLCHMQVLFAKECLNLDKRCVLFIEKDLAVNVTKFKLGKSMFQLGYLGDVIEFHLLSGTTGDVADLIINACVEVMKKDEHAKYDFAMMCEKNEQGEDADCLCHYHHILPSDLCGSCDSSSAKHYSEVLRKKKVQPERKLNYEWLTIKEITFVSESLNELSEDDQTAVAKGLLDNVQSKLEKFPKMKENQLVQAAVRSFQRTFKGPNRRNFLNIINWEETLKILGSEHECSKIALANVLQEISMNSDLNEADKIQGIAQKIDPRIYRKLLEKSVEHEKLGEREGNN